jgi:uncharacterized protein YndB with AHSA1/START domain
VRPLQRLVFTWFYEKTQTCGKPTCLRSPERPVTVEFRRMGDSTEITLTHERFTTREEHEGTLKGWKGCFDVLEQSLRV